ncbi:MAG: nucleotidyltransferase family protein [Gammaproteobacteria bacterium]|nr:MAG: nucleotidyltransferase family protein [Gammaproteobacteria bacterium]TDJ36182.1 MAG: nucleotidyltransferase family protein [Gammaproteobacteria bacterium]
MSTTLKTAIVLAGGLGVRLRPFTEEMPKAMVEVQGKPLLHWIILWLAKNDIERIVIGVAYKKEKIINWVESHAFGPKIEFSHHEVESGTGGGIRRAVESMGIEDEVYLVMNGDELCDLPLDSMLRFHLKQTPIATILSTPLRSNFGVVEIDSRQRITSFEEKPLIDSIFVNSGVYLFDQQINSLLPKVGDIEKTTFVSLAKEKRMAAYRYFGFWRTINTEKDLQDIEDNLDFLIP